MVENIEVKKLGSIGSGTGINISVPTSDLLQTSEVDEEELKDQMASTPDQIEGFKSPNNAQK